ncbi:MAG: hypothetical protein Q7J98_04105 [Kiritimatiellia bacterium]|nr:hypothetical protein [Kiritimatiellia bacterium]
MKRMGLCVATVMMLLVGFRAGATPQIPEKINYRGGTLTMTSKPLETFFTKDNPKPNPAEYSRTGSFACYRGYVGTWKVEDGYLWLASLASATGEPIPPSAFNKAWIFPVKATWYTGNLLVRNYSSEGKQVFQKIQGDCQFIIQVKEGKIVGEHEADREHPLAVLIEAESLTAENITSAVISRTTADKTGEYKVIPREELDGLLKVMASGKRAAYPRQGEDKKDGYYVMLKGGTFGNTGGISLDIHDDGKGTYIVDFIGHNFESKELAELAKRIYDSPKTVPAKMEKDGSFIAVSEELKP